ncbi:MAG: hypothetical protein PHF00_13040, partial [Elusimicrobia bacterium]|nr:hypothetical protein [Elusimicrobiota bacterium]
EKEAAWLASAPSRLPGAFGRLTLDNDFAQRLLANPFLPATSLASGTQRAWAKCAARDYALDEVTVRERVMRSAIREQTVPRLRSTEGVKTAAADPLADEVVKQYCLYKLAFLEAWQADAGFEDLCEHAILQNYV